MKIEELKDQQQFKIAAAFLAKIQQNSYEEFYAKNIVKMVNDNYKLAAVFGEGEIVGLVGVRPVNKLLHGLVLEIEDFEINSQEEKERVEKLMIEWVLKQASDFNCGSITCNLSTTKLEAHKFFSTEKFILEGFFFKKELHN
jgi:hypothetical protein